MKKMYFPPEMELLELGLVGMLCVSGIEGGDGDGGVTPDQGDPSDPGWGSDY